MLTRLNLKRGGGLLAEPNPQVGSRRTHISQDSPIMAHEEGHEGMYKDERILIKNVFQMSEMVKFIYEERNSRFQAESSKPPKGNGGNGRDGDKPPPSPPSSPSSSSTSTPSQKPPPSPKGHGKTPFLKLNINF